MRKKISFLVAALVCLVLAQVGLTLWQSFTFYLPNKSAGSNWLLEFYNPMVPVAAGDWVIHAVAIACVMALAVVLRHRLGFDAFTSFVMSGVIGAAVIPLFISIVHAAAFEDHQYFGSYAETLRFTTEVLMTQGAMVAHVITSALAAMLGIAFGRYLTKDAPAGPNALGVIATHALTIVQRLRKRDSRAMLETTEA